MKVITLHQPFASLVVLSYKQFETRAWTTPHRGPLLIHAGANTSTAGISKSRWNRLSEFLRDQGYEGVNNLPKAAIIGMVNVVDITKCYDLFDHETGQFIPDAREIELGAWECNTYAWLLENPVAFEEPIPMPGSPGIWNYSGINPEYAATFKVREIMGLQAST